MEKYKWAVNPIKLQRAMKLAKDDSDVTGKPVTAKSVKEKYISLGGKLQNDTTNNKEDNKSAEKIQPNSGGSSSVDDVSLG